MTAAERFLASQRRKAAKREKARALMAGPEGDRRRRARWDAYAAVHGTDMDARRRAWRERYEASGKKLEAHVRWELRKLAEEEATAAAIPAPPPPRAKARRAA